MANNHDILSEALDGNYDAIKEKVLSKNDLQIYDKQGYSLFMLAVDSGNIELVTYLISIGANINESLDDGTMAIHMAASAGNIDIIKLLANNNAQLNALAGTDLSTPMHFAMESESMSAYKLLARIFHRIIANMKMAIKNKTSAGLGEAYFVNSNYFEISLIADATMHNPIIYQRAGAALICN